jgi:hypothetical protein
MKLTCAGRPSDTPCTARSCGCPPAAGARGRGDGSESACPQTQATQTAAPWQSPQRACLRGVGVDGAAIGLQPLWRLLWASLVAVIRAACGGAHPLACPQLHHCQLGKQAVHAADGAQVPGRCSRGQHRVGLGWAAWVGLQLQEQHTGTGIPQLASPTTAQPLRMLCPCCAMRTAANLCPFPCPPRPHLHQMRRSKCQEPIIAPNVMMSSSQELRYAVWGRSHTSSHTRMAAAVCVVWWAGEGCWQLRNHNHRRRT